MGHTRSWCIILDLDSSESPVHGEQEGADYNGYFKSICYHPLFCFNQFGDCEGTLLRPGHVPSAENWRRVLVPIVRRYRDSSLRKYLRAGGAFACPELYQYLEQQGFRYAIRLPDNPVLQRQLEPLLTRPAAWGQGQTVVQYYDTHYQAASWQRPRRVVAKVEWHCGELLNVEIFDTLLEVQVLVERWRREYNTVRPHSVLHYRPPAPEALQPWPPASATPRLPAMAIEAVGLTWRVVSLLGAGQVEKEFLTDLKNTH